MLDVTALEKTPIAIVYEEIWEGEPPRTPRPNFEKVRGVHLGLTPAEWCNLAMHEGDSYIGGCCGTTSAMQDIINSVFRDSGYADADALWTLGEHARNHPDGFKDSFTTRWTQKRFDETCAKWETLRPWEKIAVAWQAVRDKVTPYSHQVSMWAMPEPRPDLDEKREIDELYDALSSSKFAIFKYREENDPKKQEHANEVITRAKLLCGARRLVAKLTEDFTTFEGVAVVETVRPDVVTRNGFGMCLFGTEEHARDMIATWEKVETPARRDQKHGGKSPSERVRIRPVRVSVQKGLEFLDVPNP